MSDYDVIVCPTTATAAPPHGATFEESNKNGFYTGPYNLTGWPGTVVRCGASSEGLPIGVQVIARPWREDVSLAVAAMAGVGVRRMAEAADVGVGHAVVFDLKMPNELV